MLAQFVMIVFGLFAVLALVSDMGYVTLTRVQMQNAADAAAIEGLRFRNVGTTIFDMTDDPFVSDCVRRSAARNIVSWTFDDNFNTDEDEAFQFGAGPQVDFTEGVGTANALQSMNAMAPRVYKPSLQTNQGNRAHGDMVSGTFTYTDDPELIETDTYERVSASGVPDFEPLPPVQPPNTSACGDLPAVQPSLPRDVESNEAFLVRLRRTESPRAIRNNEGDQIEDESSSGPTLPLLFGRGAMMPGVDLDDASYSPRHDGIAVRATAIAQVRPALRVGGPNAAFPEMGAVPYAIPLACWEALGANEAATVGETGVITIAGNELCRIAPPMFIEPARTVGAPVTGAVSSPACIIAGTACPEPLTGFVPIFTDVNGILRVVGFGRAVIESTAPGAIAIGRGRVRVAAQNASAYLPGGFPEVFNLTADDVSGILAANRELGRPADPDHREGGALLAPVLAR